jgi:predicted glycogen debranching enzyme
MTAVAIDDRTEWLETDGYGGFASGTTSGIRTRRYHALLLPATTPPTGRMVLVNGFDAFIDTPGGTFALSTQRYLPDVLYPDGTSHIVSFTPEPWPTWEFLLPDGVRLKQELFLDRQSGACWIAWNVMPVAGEATLRVRPFLSGREYHSMHHENSACRFDVESCGAAVRFRPYDDVPPVTFASDGGYQHDPQWYRNFLYSAERERGLDDSEDLTSPGIFSWRLSGVSPRAVLTIRHRATCAFVDTGAVEAAFETARAAERSRRDALGSPLDRAADGYLVHRGSGKTLVAGYPWFTDWGRDTFIAVRGLCLATGRLTDARNILLEWAGAVSEGMLPNRFPDRGEQPEFNSVDASLWYVVAVAELRAIADERPALRDLLTREQRDALASAVLSIVSGYAAGTRYGIHMDVDGLLAAGVRGQQLTWMDARVGQREITPRIGKPVEIQALWYNAVAVAATVDGRWRDVLPRIRAAFSERFWNDSTGTLADVIDVDHVRGTRDDTLRPNQVLAVGGLPLTLIDDARARRIVDAVESELLTPIGLRSLTPRDTGYASHYAGSPQIRDAVYHQGTVWPWLMGPFVEAWVRTRRTTKNVRGRARRLFLEPLTRHLDTAGLGHISEIADADDPFTPRGCPFQAWSLGEYLRLDRLVLRVEPGRAGRKNTEAAIVPECAAPFEVA